MYLIGIDKARQGIFWLKQKVTAAQFNDYSEICYKRMS
jgi:hypothetical protein